MVNLTDDCRIKWMEPSPLWGDHGRWLRLPEQTQIATPLILRFANDEFMDELLAMLDQCPWRISEWEARPETWRDPMPSPDPIYKTRVNPSHKKLYNGSKLILNKPVTSRLKTQTPGIHMLRAKKDTLKDEPPIKLYQAAHNRFYLVTASLISKEKGYPDYNLDLSNNERATFVVRALVPREDKTGTDEYAFVTTPSGKAWKRAALYDDPYNPTQVLIQGEEQLPLFPMNYSDQCDHHRQILGGLIPVGKREEWLGAPEYGNEVETGMINPVLSVEGGTNHLRDMFFADVVEPWRALINQAQFLKESLSTEKDTFPNFSEDWDGIKPNSDRVRALKTARDQIQTGSWYILLDFANFIEKNLNHVWKDITNNEALTEVIESDPFIAKLAETTLSAECFAALAIENLIVAKNATELNSLWEELSNLEENSLWEVLKAIWELEDKLNFSSWPDNFVDIPYYLHNRIEDEDFNSDDRNLFETIIQIIEDGTWFTLIDLVVYLNTYVPNLKKFALGEISENSLSLDEKKAIKKLSILKEDDPNNPGIKSDDEANNPGINSLVDVLGVEDLSHERMTIKYSLLDALVAIKSHEDALETITFQFDRSEPPVDESKSTVIDPIWPRFLFPLADPDTDLELNNSAIVPDIDPEGNGFEGVELMAEKLKAMANMILTLIPEPDIPPERKMEFDYEPLLDQREAKFVIHCVFERPNCGPLFPALVSKPTRQIELAPFFDPDAPARPVRIQLPTDISPAGLRKYKKNAMFLISDMLCGKINKIKKLTLADLVLSVLPWPFHKDLPKVGPTGPCKRPKGNLGMFCSLSIPIVTLCALILMIIMVSLFDIFFRWIPYLFVCLPIPGFKGKK